MSENDEAIDHTMRFAESENDAMARTTIPDLEQLVKDVRDLEQKVNVVDNSRADLALSVHALARKLEALNRVVCFNAIKQTGISYNLEGAAKVIDEENEREAQGYPYIDPEKEREAQRLNEDQGTA